MRDNSHWLREKMNRECERSRVRSFYLSFLFFIFLRNRLCYLKVTGWWFICSTSDVKSRDLRHYVGTGHRTREDMTTAGNNFKIEDAPCGFKSPVWRHFGFPIYTNTTGEKWTDKTKTACKYCKRLLTYTGNTSNMQQHINRHHSEKQSNVTPPPERKLPKGQTTLMRGFASPLPHNNARVQEITRAIGYFIGKALRPFSVVENKGFRLLMNMLEPRYCILSWQHFSQVIVPKLYQEVRAHVVEVLWRADTVSFTTDGWTSRATQSHITHL